MLTTQTYVADHQARLLADARRFHVRSRRFDLRRLLSRTSRPAKPVELQPTLAATQLADAVGA